MNFYRETKKEKIKISEESCSVEVKWNPGNNMHHFKKDVTMIFSNSLK